MSTRRINIAARQPYRDSNLRLSNSAPLVSFTFDDVPNSAYTNGARILGNYDIRGTFYVASGTCGSWDTHWRVIDRTQVSLLHSLGHEIGCHTFSHARVDELDARTTEEECRQNQDVLGELCDKAVSIGSMGIKGQPHAPLCRRTHVFRAFLSEVSPRHTKGRRLACRSRTASLHYTRMRGLY
jgi:peptidoglycan/xylan/chitin deacetylase (PgdA/CDA1 family)